MFAMLRFVVTGAAILAVLYAISWLVLRRRRRQMLRDDYDHDPQAQTRPKQSWVRAQMDKYDARRSVVLAVIIFGLPVFLVLLIVYMTNFR